MRKLCLLASLMVAASGVQATLIDFEGTGYTDYGTLPDTYQPLLASDGVTIDYNGSSVGTYSAGGDHTTGAGWSVWEKVAPETYIFDKGVEMPSVWLSTYYGGNSGKSLDVTVRAYSDEAGTLLLRESVVATATHPQASGYVWTEFTGFSDLTAIRRLEFTSGGNAQVDDMTINAASVSLDFVSASPTGFIESRTPTLEVVIADDLSELDTGSVALYLNGAGVSIDSTNPDTPVVGQTTLSATWGGTPLTVGTTHTAMVIYSGINPSAGPFTNTWTFGVLDPSAEPVKVFLLGGQSNMKGQGKNSALPQPYDAAQTNVAFWNNGAWVDLAPGFGDTTGNFGPEVSFGHAVQQALPSSNIRLIKYAVNGTALYNDWAPSGGPQYTAFMSTANAALADLDAKGIPYEIAGMLWLQGEADAFENQAATYETNLRNFIADMRTQFSTPDLPFYLARVRTYYGTADQTKLVRDAQVAVADSTTNVEWFDTDSYDPLINGGHYNTPGQLNVGIDYANTYLASIAPTTIQLSSRDPAPSAVVMTADFPAALGGVLVDGASTVDTNSIALLLDGTNLVLAAGDVVKTATTTTVSHVVSSITPGVHTVSLVYEGLSPAEGPSIKTWAFTVEVTPPQAAGVLYNINFAGNTGSRVDVPNGLVLEAGSAGSNLWNNFTTPAQDSPTPATPYTMTDSDGNGGIGLSWNGATLYFSSSTGAPSGKPAPLALNQGWYGSGGTAGTNRTVELSGLDTSKRYDVYVYFTWRWVDNPVNYTITEGSGAVTNLVLGVPRYDTATESYTDYVEGKNYVVFSNLTASAAGQIDINATSADGGFSAIQIVEKGAGPSFSPTINSISMAGGTVTINWTSDTLGTYQIESKSSLAAPTWTPVTGATGLSGGAGIGTSFSVSGGNEGFFRIYGE